MKEQVEEIKQNSIDREGIEYESECWLKDVEYSRDFECL